MLAEALRAGQVGGGVLDKIKAIHIGMCFRVLASRFLLQVILDMFLVPLSSDIGCSVPPLPSLSVCMCMCVCVCVFVCVCVCVFARLCLHARLSVV